MHPCRTPLPIGMMLVSSYYVLTVDSQSFGHIFVFHILLHILGMTLIDSSPSAFRNSIGIPSHPEIFY